MGYLATIFLAILAVGLAEAKPLAAGYSPICGLALLPLPYLVAVITRRAAMRGHFRLAERLGSLNQLLPGFTFAAFVLLTTWLGVVDEWVGYRASLAAWPNAALVLTFAPYVLAQLLGIHAVACSQEGPGRARRQLVGFHLRMFASGLLPLMLYMAITIAVGMHEPLRAHVEGVALFNAAFVAAILALLASLLPGMMVRTWDTETMPPSPQREVLETVANHADFDARDLRLWHTGGHVANAAIVGIFPGTRRVLFSDALLGQLSSRELAAVFGHEIGHARRHHVLVFMAWAVAFFLGVDLLVREAGLDESSTAITLGLALAAWLLLFGWLSRRFELEADLFALRLLQDPVALEGALERVGGQARERGGWRHFSTAKRVEFLQRAWTSPGFSRRFQRRLRLFTWVGALAALAAVGGQLLQLSATLHEDRVIVDLSLGRYSSACDRAEEAGVELELRELCATAVAAIEPAERAELAQLERLLRARVSSELEDRASIGADPRELLHLTQLCALRGRSELFDLAYELDATLSSELRGRAERFHGVLEAWHEQL